MNISVGFAFDQDEGGPLSLPLSRVLVAEDYRDWRRQIRSLLQSRPEIEIVCEVADGAEAIEKAAELRPDLILMDLRLPVLNGIEACRRIRRANPRSKILFLSQEKSTDVVQAALDTGALGYVNKADAAPELARAIDAVLQGQRFISSSLELLDGEARSPRGHEVLFCFDDEAIVDGLCSFIVAALAAAEPTIAVVTESHRKSLLERLQQRGLDMKAFIQQGIFVCLDAEVPCSSAQFFQILESAAQRAFEDAGEPRRIALCGERAGRLWAQGKIEEALELERLCTQLTASRNARILCIYPSPHLHDPLGLQTVCSQHTSARYF
jgi:CheY-like chemotaxis protein